MDSSPQAAADDKRPSLAARLGWGHHGFVVESRRAALLGLSLLLALPFLVDVGGALLAGFRDKGAYGDFAIYHEAAAAFIRDPSIELYEQYPRYIYPPFFAALLGPLTYLPNHVAIAVFQLIKWAALFLSLQLAWKLVSPRGEDAPPVVALGSLALAARFLHNDLGNGNVNTFMLLAVLLGAWLIRKRLIVAAGFVVAIAACVKVTPALALVYFACKGWWKSLIGAALAGVVCFALYPSLIFGWSNNWRALAGWNEHLLKPNIEDAAAYSFHGNQSLPALLNRLVGGHRAIEAETAGEPVCVSFVTLTPKAVSVLRLTLSLAILGLLAWACRGKVDPERQPLALAAEISLVLIAMTTLSGYSWKAHYVALLPAFATLLAYLADARQPQRRRPLIARLLVAAVVLTVLTCDIITPLGVAYAETYGAVMFGAWLAAAALIALRAALRESSTTGSSDIG